MDVAIKKRITFAIVAVLAIGLIAAAIAIYYNWEIPIITSPYSVTLFEYDRYTYDTEGNVTGAYSSSPFIEDMVEIRSIYFIDGKVANSRTDNNIADRCDPEALVALLAERTSKRSNIQSPFVVDNMVWQINLQQNFRTIHIVLGKNDFWYESANQGVYKIEDGDTIERELARMLAQY